MDLSAGHQSEPPFKDVPWKIQLLVSMGLHAVLFLLMVAWWSNDNRADAPLRQVIDVELITQVRPVAKTPSTSQIEVKAIPDVANPPLVRAAFVVQRLPVERPKATTKQTSTVTADILETGQAEKNVESTAAEVVGIGVVEEIKPTDSAVKVDSTNVTTAVEESVIIYQGQIKELIEKKKRYPLTARKGRQQGRVTVVFQLDAPGNLIASHVANSSGSRLLDRAALKAVRAVGQFPVLPAELSEETQFQIDLQFTLK
jgi:protein TonB